jgi:hypothetical protein
MFRKIDKLHKFWKKKKHTIHAPWIFIFIFAVDITHGISH